MTSPRDTGGGGQGSFVRRTARRPSPSRRLCRRSPRSLLLPLPPPAFPPGSGSILTAPLEESQRPGLLRLLLRGKGDEGPRGVPLLCVALVAIPFVYPISPFPRQRPLSTCIYREDNHHLCPNGLFCQQGEGGLMTIESVIVVSFAVSVVSTTGQVR